MTKHEMMALIQQVINDAKAGILINTGDEAMPECRWMTPTTIKGRNESLFALTEADSRKLRHIILHPTVEWMIQTKAIDLVLNVRGKVNVIENPSLYNEIMEAISENKSSFWNIKKKNSNFLVIETVIESARYYYPMKEERGVVLFNERL